MAILIDYIWKDTKRILGMPITFTKYALSEDRIFLKTGFLNVQEEEIILYRVRDISLRISLFQRIFGVGSLLILSSDRTTPKLEVKNIKNPREVKELIFGQVEEMKIARKLRIGEIMDHAHADADDGFDDDFNLEE